MTLSRPKRPHRTAPPSAPRAEPWHFWKMPDFGTGSNIDAPFDLERLEVTTEYRHELFLAVREALHNVAKHAAATEVRFSVQSEPGGFVFRLEDNGRGFPARATEPNPAAPNGIGLESMRHRITKLGGTMSWANRPQGGSVVTFRIALRQRPARIVGG